MSSASQILKSVSRMTRSGAPVLREPSRTEGDSPDYYLSLIRKLLELRLAQDGAVIAAFTSVSRGEGVTYVVESLAFELSKHTGEAILITPSSGLADASSAHFWEPQRIQRLSRSPERHSLFRVPGRDDLQILKHKFGFVLVDCPAMQESSAILGIAKLTTAAFMVVAAGQARRDSVENAQRTLDTTGVRLGGLILNKRIDPVPSFLSQLL